jgi:hypothetical protein
MLRSLVSAASQYLNEWNRSLWAGRLPSPEPELAPNPSHKIAYRRLERVLLTDEVNRTILEEFAAHRQSVRGEEETGWVLLGIREERQAVVLATLPAGAGADTGVAHVRFNSEAQAVASRIVRQWDKSLTMLGVLHTHPGSLRHPSDGDYRGDSQWVGRLRGKEGIFGIGTADGYSGNGTKVAYQPKSHMQCMGPLCLSWYGLLEGERNYRPLPVGLTLGPDLAQKLRPVWSALELRAEELDRLCRQQAGIRFEVLSDLKIPALVVSIPLAEPGNCLRLLLSEEQVRYHLIQAEDLIEVDPKVTRLDRGVYLILAELAG